MSYDDTITFAIILSFIFMDCHGVIDIGIGIPSLLFAHSARLTNRKAVWDVLI